MIKKWFNLILFMSLFVSQASWSLMEISDNELSKVDGQSEGIGMILSEVGINVDGKDTAKLFINFDKSPLSEIAISELQLLGQGGGYVTIGTPDDPIYMEIVAINNERLFKMAMPKKMEHYTPMVLSLLLTTKFEQDHYMRVTLDGYKPIARRRDKNGNIIGDPIPTTFYTWSAENQGLSFAADINFIADRVIIQTDKNDTDKGRLVLHQVEMRTALGEVDPGLVGILDHPFNFNTFSSDGKLGFMFEMKPVTESNPNMPLGYVSIYSATVPGKNSPHALVPENANTPFFKIGGIEVQGMRVFTIQK